MDVYSPLRHDLNEVTSYRGPKEVLYTSSYLVYVVEAKDLFNTNPHNICETGINYQIHFRRKKTKIQKSYMIFPNSNSQ